MDIIVTFVSYTYVANKKTYILHDGTSICMENVLYIYVGRCASCRLEFAKRIHRRSSQIVQHVLFMWGQAGQARHRRSGRDRWDASRRHVRLNVL